MQLIRVSHVKQSDCMLDYIFLLQGSLLLRSGQDFTKDDVLNGFWKYNNVENWSWWDMPNDEYQFEVKS